MPYVRDRLAPASKDAARRRIAVNRQALAPSAEHPGDRLTGAYDWFRIALVYAKRRSHRSLAAGDAARGRRLQIINDAAAALQEAGCRIDQLAPPGRGRRTRRDEFRTAYGGTPALSADGRPLQLYAAHAWLLYAASGAERHARRGGTQDVARMAAEIKDQAAARLIEWAEEMDADDYGQ